MSSLSKNAGPEAVRIDYQTHAGRLAHYTPDFLMLLDSGKYVMLETKGRVDIDVPLKIRAADAWCRAASHSSLEWRYLYVPQEVFAKIDDTRLETLESLCEPTKQSLIAEKELNGLSPKCKKGIQEAIALFTFLEIKNYGVMPWGS